MLLPSFPIPVFASQHWDFGIAAELCCHGSWLCFRTLYTWDLESLPVVSLSPFYSSFSGFLRYSRGYCNHCQLQWNVNLNMRWDSNQKTKFTSTEVCKCFYKYLRPSTSYFHILRGCPCFSSLPNPRWGLKTLLGESLESAGLHQCRSLTWKYCSTFHTSVFQNFITWFEVYYQWLSGKKTSWDCWQSHNNITHLPSWTQAYLWKTTSHLNVVIFQDGK